MSVIGGDVFLAAFGADKPAAAWEVKVNVEFILSFGEGDLDNLPGRFQAKCLGKQGFNR